MEYECEICEKIIKSQIILKKHYKMTHGEHEKAHRCNVCTKSFSL